MKLTSNQLRDFSSLFSRSEVSRWIKSDFTSVDSKLKRYNIFDKNVGKTYLKILKDAYKILEIHYPNEYILKNEFINQYLKKEISSCNSVIFNELRIGKAIADLAVFNGVSKAFEIKTIFDKEYRLSNQLQEYKKIFNEVYIIVPKIHLDKYIAFDNEVGVYSYDSSKKSFFLERNSQITNDIDIDVIMEILHSKEYIHIVNQYYDALPKIDSFNQFDICKEFISHIPSNDLNILFLDIMKKRNINNIFFDKINIEFNQICLSMNLKKSEKENLILKLSSKIV